MMVVRQHPDLDPDRTVDPS